MKNKIVKGYFGTSAGEDPLNSFQEDGSSTTISKTLKDEFDNCNGCFDDGDEFVMYEVTFKPIGKYTFERKAKLLK